jgi:threonine/homoserine/homoserine lactone efflux protein
MDLLSFLAVSAVVILSPGPDMALVGRNALLGGRRIAISTSIGVALGLATWSLAATVGVATLESVTGAFLIAFGLRVATEDR